MTDKLVPRIRNQSYSDRLYILGLPSLSERRTRGDTSGVSPAKHPPTALSEKTFSRFELSESGTVCPIR